MSKTFTIKHGRPSPLDEQETIITYDKALKEWNMFTDNPTHARKYEHLVVPSNGYASSKTYHEETGELIAIDGHIDGNVSVRANRKLTDKQKVELKERMKNVRSGIT